MGNLNSILEEVATVSDWSAGIVESADIKDIDEVAPCLHSGDVDFE